MKQIAVLLFAVLVMAAPLVYAQPAGLSLALSKQTPYPAEPGKIVKVEIEAKNTGFTDSEDISIEIVPEDPFSLVPGESAKKTFSRISAMDSVKISFNLQVSSSAVTNDYELKFRVYKEGSVVSTEEKARINVQGLPNIVLDFVRTDPERIDPSGTFDIVAALRNAGSGTARQMTAVLNSSSDSIVPILSGGTVFIGDVQPEFTKYAAMKFKVDGSAEYKTYPAVLTLTFKDENNTERSKQFSIGIPVTGSIQLDLIKTEIDYSRQVLKANVANKGTTEAKSLEATLVIGNATIGIDYISQLKANKDTVFEFPAVYSGEGKLVINYIGPGIEKNIVEKSLVLNFPEPEQDSSGTIVIVIIIIVIVLWYWRRRKKRAGK
jgi:hypothetical protein